MDVFLVTGIKCEVNYFRCAKIFSSLGDFVSSLFSHLAPAVMLATHLNSGKIYGINDFKNIENKKMSTYASSEGIFPF